MRRPTLAELEENCERAIILRATRDRKGRDGRAVARAMLEIIKRKRRNEHNAIE